MEKNNLSKPSEKTYPLESINAYNFIRSQGGDLGRFLDNIRKLKQVKSTAIVAGDYDAVMRVSVPSLEKLMDVTDEIQRMPGIPQTSTHGIQKEVFPY